MPKKKILLDDDGFSLLGNALALGYLSTLVVRRQNQLSTEEAQIDRAEYSERRELREVLESSGCYEYRLEHRNGFLGESSQSLTDFDAWILEFLNRDEPVTSVRLKDFEIPKKLARYYDIDTAIAAVDPYDLRTPISRLGPCHITRIFRNLVIDYFRNRIPFELLEELPSDWPFIGSSQENTSDQCKSTEETEISHGLDEQKESFDLAPNPARRHNKGFERTDEPYVEEGYAMLKDGRAKSAAAAAQRLVDLYGTTTSGAAHEKTQEILTNSPSNTTSRLARKISKMLKDYGN